MFIIRILKRCAAHIRTSAKVLIIVAIAGLIITGLALYIYKPTYSVSLNGEFIGYTREKGTLQAKINSYLGQGDGDNVAFIQVDNMPEYNLCLLKKDVQTNDDEIYNKVISQGTTYYRYYALLKDGKEKYFFSTFDEAEAIINELKEKNSANVDKLTVVEKYNTQKEDFSEK